MPESLNLASMEFFWGAGAFFSDSSRLQDQEVLFTHVPIFIVFPMIPVILFQVVVSGTPKTTQSLDPI